MLRGLFGWADSFESRVLLDIDSGGGSGGGEGDPPDDKGGDGDPPKTYTQDEVEKLITSRLKSAKRDAKQKDQQLEALQAKFKELETKLADIPPATGDKDKDAAGKLEIQAERHRRELDSLKNEVAEAKARAEKAEIRQREVERNTILTNALSEARCIDLEAGRRYFMPQITWDELDNQWMFITKSGNTIDIAEGVSAELPTYLKPSSMQGGGSGTPSGNGRKAVAQRDLDAEKAKLDEIRATIKKRPNDRALPLEYDRQKKKVAALESQLAAIK